MSTRIRLARAGSKNRPFFRIVVSDKRSPRDGKFIEMVGTYNPLLDPAEVSMKQDRIKYWIDQGAIPTDTVKSLLKKEGFSLRQLIH